MKPIKIKKEQGFSILAIILVIVAIVVAIGVWALSGQSNSSSSQNSSAELVVSSILNDSSSIKSRFDELVIGGANPENITFKPNLASSYNILDPQNGIPLLKAPTNAIRGESAIPEGIYVYSKTIKGNQIGSEKDDYAIVLAGVKATVCRKLNYITYGSENVPKITSIGNAAGFVANATAADPNTTVAIDLSSMDSVQGWTMGCVASGSSDSDENFFFRILKPN